MENMAEKNTPSYSDNSRLWSALASLGIIAAAALPLLSDKLREMLFYMYRNIANGSILTSFDASVPPNESFFSMAILECITLVCVFVCAFAVRTAFKIDTAAKKILFVLGMLFYIIPHQVLLVVICVDLAQNGAGENCALSGKNLFAVWTSVLYFGTLAMSLLSYKILAARKNSAFKAALAVLGNLLLAAAAVAPMVFESAFGKYEQWQIYVCFALAAAWLATEADIVFEGFGYRIVQRLLRLD